MQGFYLGRDKRFFFPSQAFRPAVGCTQPPIQWVTGTFPTEVKWPGHETDYLRGLTIKFANSSR